MKPLILLVGMLALLSAADSARAAQAEHAESPQADWRRDGVDERVKAALTSSGWRLEDDGRALDPKTKAPAAKSVLDKAVLDLRQGAQRAALETVNLLLASGKPLSSADQRKIATLSEDLPPSLVAAIRNPRSDMNRVKAMAGADLARVASYFDGGRTMADREAAARPVSAGTPGPRVELPYYTSLEKSVGERLQSSAQAEIGKDPFGKTVLSRLNAKTGKPDLPPIIIEDQNGTVIAQYDIRRRAIVLDREGVLASIVGTVPPRQALALRATLSTRAALMSYLEAHPEAVSAVVKDNDVVIVHELTHAWQDRRDTIFREMTRGNLPDTAPLEYEEEAYKTKNLYIHSKMRNDPASVKMDQEFEDYRMMMLESSYWRVGLMRALNSASPSRALPLKSLSDIQSARLSRAAARTVSTADERKAKALDLLAMSRAQKELLALETEHARRMAPMTDDIRKSGADQARLLGTFYLGRALNAANAVERGVLLDKAEAQAKASKNAILIEDVRKAKERK